MTRNMLLIYAYEAYKWRVLSIARDMDEEPTLVAQAVTEPLRLLTADAGLASYSELVVLCNR